jgi:pyruvate/2-oxoacid:ferredoxin oxidoreductase alpha subunit
MTPASTLINYITKNPNVTFFQAEDEIAVAMSML